MKWENDLYKDLKWQIFNILKIELPEKIAEKVTIKMATDSIDELIKKLTGENDE